MIKMSIVDYGELKAMAKRLLLDKYILLELKNVT